MSDSVRIFDEILLYILSGWKEERSDGEILIGILHQTFGDIRV
jgi:hypothetical protein